MAIQVNWKSIDPKVLHWQAIGDITWEQIFEARETANTMCATTEMPVFFVYDILDLGAIPKDSLSRIKELSTDVPHNVQANFLISNLEGFIGTMIKAFVRIHGKYQIVSGFDEIMERIAETQPEIA